MSYLSWHLFDTLRVRCCPSVCVLLIVLQPCASGYLWYSSKHAADLLLNRSKAEPVWLRDSRTGHDLALAVKKSRRPGFNGGCSTTTSRINVMNFHSGTALSTASNSSSYLPVLHNHLAGFAAAQHSQELHSNSARLAAAAAGMSSGNLDPYSMLQNANVMRLLPLQQGNPALLGPAAQVMLQGNGASSGYMAHDVCEAMLDYCDSAGLNMGMPVHLQPAMAAQVCMLVCRKCVVSGMLCSAGTWCRAWQQAPSRQGHSCPVLGWPQLYIAYREHVALSCLQTTLLFLASMLTGVCACLCCCLPADGDPPG